MSSRFTVNLLSLLLGSGLVIVDYAFPRTTLDNAAIGIGAAAILGALFSFAQRYEGIFQRIVDVFLCLIGAWVIVAARVLEYHGRWLIVPSGLALVALGTLGLIVREARLSVPVQVGQTRIGTDQFMQISRIQRDAGVSP